MKTHVWLLLLFSCLTLQVDADENLIRPQQLHVFPKQSELVYGWRADVSTGARVTDSHDNHASHFAITANLRVRSDATSPRVEFKLEDMQYSSYNGKVTKDGLPVIKTSLLKKCKTCGKPFIANYDGGQPGNIDSVELSSEDEVYARNMKRAIMAQFQLDFQNIPLKRAFHNMENGVSGWCSMDRNLKDLSGNGTIFTLSKLYYNDRCSQPAAREEYLSFRSYQPDQKNEVIMITERNYVIVSKSPDTLMINEIKSRSETNMQPHGLESELHFHFTKQELHLISDGEASTDGWEIGETLKSSLEFETPKENIELGTNPDMTFGAMKHDSKNAVNKTMAIMRKLAAKFHSKGTDKTQTEELHALSTTRQIIFHTLKRMSSESLEQLVQKVLLTKDGTLRAVLLEILPRIGTLAATRTIVALYNNNTDLTTREKSAMLMVMPFHLRHRTEQLIKDCESLLTSDNSAAILAFSSVMGEACELEGVCSRKLMEDYIKRISTKLEESKTYGEKLLYLQALNNIGTPPVMIYLQTIIRDRVNYDHNLRYAASWSCRFTQMRGSELIYNLYWPILADSKEHPEMRQSALINLLMSGHTPNRFISLFWFINSARNQGLYTLFYTTVQSLLNTNYPFLIGSRSSGLKAAKAVARLMPKKNIPSYAPTNMIWDDYDSDTGTGIKFQEFSIEDVGGHPTLKYFDVKRYLNGQISKDFSLHTRGISIDLSFFLGHFNRVWDWKGQSNVTIPVAEVFKSLGVMPRNEFSDSFEIILRVRDRTVLCLHYKEIREKEVMEMMHMLGLPDLMMKLTSVREGSPVTVTFNKMTFDLSTAQETVVANDVGLPVTYFTQHPDMVAFVGNLSVKAVGNKTIMNSNLALRFIGQRARGMYTLNPIIGQWQGVVRSKVGDISLPLGHRIEVEYSNRSVIDVTLKWKKDQDLFNAMNHVHTTTYAIGDDHSLIELKLSCPKCSNIHAVSSGTPQEINQLKQELLDSEFELTADLYDCETPKESKYREMFWNALTSSRSKNVRNSPWWIRLFMRWQQLNDVNEKIPYSGSYGQVIRIAPKGEARQLNLVWNTDHIFRHFFAHAVYKRENGETIKTWTMDMKSTSNSTDIEQMASIIHIRHQLQENPNQHMFCLKMDAESPKQIDDNDVWDVLYEPPWRPYVLRLGITIGDTEDGTCPTKSGGKLLLTASSTPRKPHKDGYLCERDVNHVFPATVECSKAIHNALNAQNISINIQHNNLPENIQSTAAKLVTKLHSSLPYINPAFLSNSLSVDIESNPDGTSAVWINKTKKQLTTQLVWEVLDVFKLRAAFFSTHKEKRSCVAAGGYVNTYDDSSFKFTAGTQWTLLSAHCGPVPMFAVFVRHVEGSDTLDTRVYVGRDVFDVSRRNNKTFDVIVNGDPFDPLQQKECKNRIDVNDDVVRILNPHFSVWVKISNRSVTVTTSSVLYGLTCGLCGDYNYQLESEYGFPGPDGKPVAPEDIASVYSITDIEMNATPREHTCRIWE